MHANKFAGMIVRRLIEDTKVTQAYPKSYQTEELPR